MSAGRQRPAEMRSGRRVRLTDQSDIQEARDVTKALPVVRRARDRVTIGLRLNPRSLGGAGQRARDGEAV